MGYLSLPALKGRLVLFLAILLTAFSCSDPDTSKSQRGVSPAQKGLTREGNLQLSERDRCPVCAMLVMKHPKSACAMELRDRTTYHFCDSGCMIRAWLHPETVLGVEKDKIKRIIVQGYFSGKPLDASSCVWVAGSDVVGPMGPAVVPLKDEEALKAFRRRHGGEWVFRLNQMDGEKWKRITGKTP